MADRLGDLRAPVQDKDLVYNLLRGLNPHPHPAIPHITKWKMMSFLKARSFLMLEEFCLDETTKVQAVAVFFSQARSNACPPSSGTPTPPSSWPSSGNTTRVDNGVKKKNKKAAMSSGDVASTLGNQHASSSAPAVTTFWQPGFNPWTGMVQAWPMPMPPMPLPLAPGAGVLGPWPITPPYQAHTAQALLSYPTQLDPQLLTALSDLSTNPPSSSGGDWYLDTGASSHMALGSGKLSSLSPHSSSSWIVVGNGHSLPVTHTGSMCIPTNHSPLHLHDILVSPHLIKNLISIRSLTRDNFVYVEFDPSGFFVKGLEPRR
ncbi:uncharacterized protein LOC133927815 [Phragmites australis]|uniref:uncharacterized protein LOC133927815 n=1 Tax=Phragmites australis TaxID=29695 RepID=UPI002D793CDF|nr:uncharacterized protein LOC133927815 [Phragmites australis]